MLNCCLKYKLFVGRGHDPADHLGQLSGKNASKMCKLPEIQYSSVSLRCGGVMTPPYDGVYFSSLNNNLAFLPYIIYATVRRRKKNIRQIGTIFVDKAVILGYKYTCHNLTQNTNRNGGG